MILVVLLLALLILAQSLSEVLIPIYDEDDLMKISECLNCNYTLQANLTLTKPWAAIGSASKPFTGKLYGQHNTITLSGFSASSTESIGLFGVMSGAWVYYLNLVSSSADGLRVDPATTTFGLLAGTAVNGNFIGCTAVLKGEINAPASKLSMGGLFGSITGSSIILSFANVSLEVTSMDTMYFGAFAGNSSVLAILNSEAYVSFKVADCNSLIFGGMVSVSESGSAEGTVVTANFVSHAKAASETVGGLIGYVPTSLYANAISNTFATMVFEADTPGVTTLGGLLGSCSSPISITNIDALFTASSTRREVSAGGCIGSIAGPFIQMASCSVNATLHISAQEPTSRTTYAGGLVGNDMAGMAAIVNVIIFASISLNSTNATVGGLTGVGTKMFLASCGVLGSISISSTLPGSAVVGGIVGNLTGSGMNQAFFIGDITVTQSQAVTAGALVGLLDDVPMQFSYALANISVAAKSVSLGTVATARKLTLTQSYAVVRMKAAAEDSTTIGGISGYLAGASAINESFVLVGISCSGAAEKGAIGGLVGIANSSTAKMNISNCYGWGSVSSSLKGGASVTLGGFAGSLLGTVTVTNCLAYMTMASSASTATAGLLAGRTALQDATEPLQSGSMQFIVAYVTPEGNLSRVTLIGKSVSVTMNNVYCADYPKTAGCNPVGTLNSKAFLSAFDFKKTFQLDTALASGNLALKILPAPSNETTINAPHLTMPDKSVSPSWSPDMWINSEALLSGFPFLKKIKYSTFCRASLGCHGLSVSPTSVLCNPGWLSPESLSPYVAKCSIFKCTSSGDCNWHGSCISGACSCDDGFSGPDCTAAICPLDNGVPCGANPCKPFSVTSAMGLCMCQKTQFVMNSGVCVTACEAMGVGICGGSNYYFCVEGYSPGKKCLEYDCSAATRNICNNKGTCGSDKKCKCNDDAQLIAGNCYTSCSDTTTENCTHVDCGANNTCSDKWLCAPSLFGKNASCECNVSTSGKIADIYLGGSLCQGCATGYRKHNGSCVLDNCLLCVGGKCAYDDKAKAIACMCEKDQKLLAGVCFNDHCGPCASGACMSIPGSANPSDRYCFCANGLPDKACYGFACGSCAGGACILGNKTMTTQCICPPDTFFNATTTNCNKVIDRAPNYVPLILGIVVAGAVLIVTVIAVVVTIAVCGRKRHLTIYVANHPSRPPTHYSLKTPRSARRAPAVNKAKSPKKLSEPKSAIEALESLPSKPAKETMDTTRA